MDSAKAKPTSYTYGPVPSRRLGLSLGVDIVPAKICTLDCIYCQVGRTTRKSIVRQDFMDIEAVLAELKASSRPVSKPTPSPLADRASLR